MPFFHSKNIIKPKFFFPAFNNKAVSVKQKDKGKNTDNPLSKGKKHTYFPQSVKLVQIRGIGQGGHNIKHCNCDDAGNHIRNIVSGIFADILQRQLRIEHFTHKWHRLPVRRAGGRLR